MKKILFVCTGNTCRSFMAVLLALQELKKKGLAEEVVADSAGTAALEGMPASTRAAEALKELGVGIYDHHSKPYTRELAADVDLILTMTSLQKEQAVSQAAEIADRIHRLADYALGGKKEGFDVADPVGGEAKAYQECARILAELVPKALARFLQEKNSSA